MSAIRSRPRGRFVLLGVVAAGVVVAGLGVGGVVSLAAGDADTDAGLAGQASPSPVPVTEEQCARAHGMLLASLAQARDDMSARGDVAGLAQLNAVFGRSLAWVERGCPPDPVRGFYPAPGGNGGELRLLDETTIGSGGANGVLILEAN